MNERADGTLNLEEVAARFLRAEEELRQLVAAGERLKAESEQLADAKVSVREVASKGTHLLAETERLSTEVRQLVQAIQRTEPAAVLRRLDDVEKKVEESHERLAKLQRELTDAVEVLRRLDDVEKKVEGGQERLASLQLELTDAVNVGSERLVAETRRVRTVAIVAAVVAAVAAVLAGLGLIL